MNINNFYKININHFPNKINPSFQGIKPAPKLEQALRQDVFEKKTGILKEKLLEVRDAYLKNNKDAYITLDHIKTNFDNWFVAKSVENQTEDLQAVSTEDFCNLSEIMKNIRLPENVTVYRAMEAKDFNIDEFSAEEFFEKYYSDGKKITVPIYMSSSLDKNVAYRFAKSNPYRFIIKLNIPKGHPAVYMENLAPHDTNHFDNEEEINVIRNSEIIIKNLKKTINPLSNDEIYELEGDVIGFKDIKPKPKEVVLDDEMIEFRKMLLRNMM